MGGSLTIALSSAGATNEFAGTDGVTGGFSNISNLTGASGDQLTGLDAVSTWTQTSYTDGSETLTISGASDLQGTISDSGGVLTVGDNAIIDGAADAVQLTVQGYTTQTNHILVVEETGATDLFWVTNDGDVEMNGTTPALTIGDAGTEDTSIVFDGQAQDYHIGLMTLPMIW